MSDDPRFGVGGTLVADLFWSGGRFCEPPRAPARGSEEKSR
jgi:hypothetical protein